MFGSRKALLKAHAIASGTKRTGAEFGGSGEPDDLHDSQLALGAVGG